MKNFSRALRLIFRYKWTLAASCFTAIMVAILWTTNISGIYPLIGLVTEKRSLQEWVDSEIDKGQKGIADFDADIARLDRDLAANNPPPIPDERKKLEHDHDKAQRSRDAAQTYLERCRWLKPYIDRFMPTDPYQTLIVIVGFMAAGYTLKNIFLVFDSLLVDRLSNLATLDLRKKFYRRTLRMDLSSFGEARVSELMSRFTYDIDCLGAGIETLLGRAIREPLKMLTCLAAAAYVNPRLLLLSLIFAPPAAYLIRRVTTLLKKANRKALEEMSFLYNILSESFGGIKVVKAFTMEPFERLRFHRNSKEFYRKAMKIARYDALLHPLTEMAGIAMIFLTILCGTYLVMSQNTHLLGIKMSDRPLSLPQLLVFYGFLVGTIDPARKLTEVFNRIQRASAAADRVYQVFDREPNVRDPIKPREFKRHHRDIVFDQVQFGYNAEQTVLHKIDLRVHYGETLAIVGPNGCGKTTLVNLLPRFYDPRDGSIRVDDVDLREIRMRDLRSQIGLVTQDPLLFDDTVFNNIRYGTPSATKQQVVEAAKKAYAHTFIEELLENSYDTNIGQLGGRLSGGQRQRIALARAILRDPPILILDEATSQIDIESEHLIHKVLEQFARDRTAIIITHRLSTLDLADRILVMDQGRILDLGTHKELIGRCALYQRLYQISLREAA